MKIVKHYWFVAIALITMISFSSCESDEERGFDISGLYGKTWWGDMGFEDRYGEPLYSYITFTSGAFTDHGVGTEERCYHNDELYRVYKFDWEIQNGWLYLYYSDGYTFIIEYPSVSGRYFYGTRCKEREEHELHPVVSEVVVDRCFFHVQYPPRSTIKRDGSQKRPIRLPFCGRSDGS